MIRIVRLILVPALVGAMSISVAWAGAGLAPVPVTPDELVASAAAATATAAVQRSAPGEAGGPPAGVPGAAPVATTPGEGPPITPPPFALPDADGLLAGAAKVSIYPDPDEAAGERWETEGCNTLGSDAPAALGHAFDTSSPWPRNPNCIYVGGYGIGPMNGVKDFDTELGLWARSVALSDGEETLVLTVVDGVYWFGEYASMCDGCGAFALAEELGDELGIDPAGLVFTATHSHTAPDFIGGWGGVPEWYMEQVADALRDSVRGAVRALEPATLEAGEVLAREHNRERRKTYRSAEEAGLSWLRAVDADGATIGTVGAYAAHPTTVGLNDGIAHPDWPGVFAARAEERFGGVAAHFMTGLGNMSAAGGTQIGARLADLIPAVGGGTPVTGTDVAVSRVFWDHPVTNPALTGLALPGFFDRPFSGPAAVSKGKAAERPCVSSSPVSVHTSVTAARVGNLWFTGAPGEIFSNYSNTVKERTAGNGTIATFPLGMANDAMGYIIQSVETFDESRLAALGFSGQRQFEYEDAYSIDRCFGDMALETTLGLIDGLRQ
jgi:hypothetical protein